MNENGVSLLIGAALAVIGGMISDGIRGWRERARERNAMKICILDEINDIISTLEKMHEVWEHGNVLPAFHVNDVCTNTTAFDSLRLRLFLIKDDDLRKKIFAFYKKLKDLGEKSKGKVGSLADTPKVRDQQSKFDIEFQALCTDAKEIRDKLS